ncbi:hypothetical protein JCM19301_2423 [Jejuia pallidilutea]|uniref:Uncharacterized protein n=1 Tax=Jejuia pallidilutea TaxID=504487 RepID=A0A090VQN1_9FLAO|nr:hypothetical protein JCM19301_2423 [Jejuia pallidilutea]
MPRTVFATISSTQPIKNKTKCAYKRFFCFIAVFVHFLLALAAPYQFVAVVFSFQT